MLPEKRWKPEAVLMLCVGVCFCLCLDLILLSGLGRLLPDLDRLDKDLLTFIIGTVFIQGAALGWIYAFLRWHGVGWSEAFGFRTSRAELGRALALGGLGVVVALPAAVVLGKLAELALARLGLTPQVQLAVKMLQHQPSAGQLVIYGLGAILLAPTAEEMLFRGLLYPTLKESGHPQLALWITSLFFALTHDNLTAFLPLTFLALVLTWLYERTTNLLAPIVTHALFNAVNFALLVLQPAWFKGN